MLSGIAVGFAAALSATTALADVLIATAGPITGQLAALGEQYRQGASKAVADINAAGGVMGRPIEVRSEDSVNPATAATKATAAGGLVSGFIDLNGAAIQAAAVHCGNSGIGIGGIGKGHKAESTAATGVPIIDHIGFGHFAETGKTLPQTSIIGIPAQTADEQFL